MSNHHHNHCGCHGHGGEGHEHGGENHGHSCCGGHHHEIILSDEDAEFLMCLAQTPFLPLAQFVLKSSKSSHLESVALAPVFLNDKADSMESVKKTGAVLKRLADYGLITLDYDEPLENGDYTIYSDSALFAYFTETVTQAAKKPDYLFDIADLELGSIALTRRGQLAIQKLESSETGESDDSNK